MARPKSNDPAIAVQFRMKQSAVRFWGKQAAQHGHKLHKEIQRVLEERADREVMSGDQLHDALTEVFDGKRSSLVAIVKPSDQVRDVKTNFKDGKK